MNSQNHKRRINQFTVNRIIAFGIFLSGIVLLLASFLYVSLISAMIGLGLVFWGALMLYITPTKHVPLELLTAMTTPTQINIEKVLLDSHVSGNGIYLPPKYLKDPESSLVFVPANVGGSLPQPEEVDEQQLYSKNPKGVFLTPTGFGLSKLLENKLGYVFTQMDLKRIQEKLPKLLVEKMEIAEDIVIKTEGNVVGLELKNHIFNDVCQETRKLERLHEAIGCPLPSAVACALAKATKKPVTIEKEEQSQDKKTTIIQYRLLEE